MALLTRLVTTCPSCSALPSQRAGVRFDFEGNALFLGEGTQEFDGFAGDPVQVARLAGGGGFAGVEPGQRQQRFGEPAHALGGALAGGQAFAVFGGGAFAGEGSLRLREHDGDGRAQFVRGVGGELRLPGESWPAAGQTCR